MRCDGVRSWPCRPMTAVAASRVRESALAGFPESPHGGLHASRCPCSPALVPPARSARPGCRNWDAYSGIHIAVAAAAAARNAAKPHGQSRARAQPRSRPRHRGRTAIRCRCICAAVSAPRRMSRSIGASTAEKTPAVHSSRTAIPQRHADRCFILAIGLSVGRLERAICPIFPCAEEPELVDVLHGRPGKAERVAAQAISCMKTSTFPATRGCSMRSAPVALHALVPLCEQVQIGHCRVQVVAVACRGD